MLTVCPGFVRTAFSKNAVRGNELKRVRPESVRGITSAVAEMERNMRINEDVLRFLTVRVDALEEGPSAVMQSRGRSDDRPRRSYGGDRRDEGRDRDEPRDGPSRDAPVAVEGVEA